MAWHQIKCALTSKNVGVSSVKSANLFRITRSAFRDKIVTRGLALLLLLDIDPMTLSDDHIILSDDLRASAFSDRLLAMNTIINLVFNLLNFKSYYFFWDNCLR